MSDPFDIDSYDRPEPDPYDSDLIPFDDGVLEPFSPRRRRLAGLLGLRFFQALDVEFSSIAQFRSWRGLEQDVAIVLWVCTLDHKLVDRALVYPDQSRQVLNDWADARALAPGEPQWSAALQAAGKILWDIVERMTASVGGEDEDANSDNDDSAESAEEGQKKTILKAVTRIPALCFG